MSLLSKIKKYGNKKKWKANSVLCSTCKGRNYLLFDARKCPNCTMGRVETPTRWDGR